MKPKQKRKGKRERAMERARLAAAEAAAAGGSGASSPVPPGGPPPPHVAAMMMGHQAISEDLRREFRREWRQWLGGTRG